MNVGKAIRLASRFSPLQFSVYGGSSDFLVPTLEAGGGMSSLFPFLLLPIVSYPPFACALDNADLH